MQAMKNSVLATSLVSATLLTLSCAAGTTAAQVGQYPSMGSPNAAAASPLGTAPLTTSSRGKQVGFVTTNGFAVYVFDLDLSKPGTSQCNDACAAHWPAIPPPDARTLAAPWGTISRADGTKQLTYGGRPLYAYVADKNTTEAKGDMDNARGGIWHLAQAQSQGAQAPVRPMPPAVTTPTSGY
jgi:predicted lipoprotein with Yx(FWY)xxD motif